MAVFSYLVVVGNLTTTTTAIGVWWNYDYCTLFWVNCPCPSLEWSSSLIYVYMFKATLAMSNTHNMSTSNNYWWMLSKDACHSSSSPEVCNGVACDCQHVFFWCNWSIYNVVVHDVLLYWGLLMHIVHVCWQYWCTNCLRHHSEL